MNKSYLTKFNDPEDFKFGDRIIEKMLSLPDGTETTTSIMFEEIAPDWEPEDVDLSAIDAEVRRKAKENGIALITPIQYRNCVMRKPYDMPYKILKTGAAKNHQ